jgi:hypothetical protein
MYHISLALSVIFIAQIIDGHTLWRRSDPGEDSLKRYYLLYIYGI